MKRSGGASSWFAFFLSFQCHDVQAPGEKRIYSPSPLVPLPNHRPERAHSFT